MNNTPATTPPRLLYPVQEACELLGGICAKTLWNYTQPRGPIRCLRIGTRVMYDARDLAAWIDRQKKGALG